MFKRSFLNTFSQGLGKVMMLLISLVTTAVLTRRLGVEVYGSYILVTSVFILIDSLADFGSKVIGVREASKRKGEERNNVFVQVIWMRIITSLLAFGLGLLLIFLWKGFELIRLEAVISLTMIFLTSLSGSLEVIFQSEERLDLKVIMDVIFPLSFLLILIFWPNKITLLWIFGMYLISKSLSLFFGLRSGRFVINKILLTHWDFSFFKKLIKKSWPMGLYLIVFAGYDRAVDSMMIERMVGIREVAFYGLAYKIYGNLVQPVYFFIISIFPKMSKDSKKNSLLERPFLLILMSLFFVIPLIYILSPLIIKVLAGSEFVSSIFILRILLIALFFAYLNHLFGFKLISLGGQKKILILGLIVLVFNIIGNLLMIPRLGIVGAALVTASTEALMLVLTLFFLKKK